MHEKTQATIRTALGSDFDSLYAIGVATPEFKVGADGEFMERDEFLGAINSPSGIFLTAELEGRAVGFIYANRSDIECGEKTKWACLVYLVVMPQFRGNGIAGKLYEACITELKRNGVNKVYGWASAEGDGAIIDFMKKQGFSKGHQYVWMDRKI